MKIELAPEHRKRYLEYRRIKERLYSREKGSLSERPRIRVCHLTPRQRKKKEEMDREGFP
jgi:hypothetical protein